MLAVIPFLYTKIIQNNTALENSVIYVPLFSGRLQAKMYNAGTPQMLSGHQYNDLSIYLRHRC